MFVRDTPPPDPGDAIVVVGGVLSVAQGDGNIINIANRLTALETTVANGWLGLDPTNPFSLVGSSLYEKLTNGMTYGPFQIPQVGWNLTNPTSGAWLPNHQYYKFDAFNFGATLYLVLADHISAVTFDPNANNGMGQNYYSIVVAMPAIPPTGGLTGQVLAKRSNTNYDTLWIDPPSTSFVLGSTTITSGATVTALAGLTGVGLTAAGAITGGASLTFAAAGGILDNVNALIFRATSTSHIDNVAVINLGVDGVLKFNGESFLSAVGPGQWRLGDVDNASPMPQTISMQGVADAAATDTGGPNFTIVGGPSTGAGKGGDIRFQVYIADGNTGDGQNYPYDAFIIDGRDKSARITCNSRSSQPNGFAPLGFYYDDGGTHYDNIGQTSGYSWLNLPRNSPGLHYMATAVAPFAFMVSPYSGVLGVGGFTTGNEMGSAVPYSTLVAEAVDFDNYAITSLTGVWEMNDHVMLEGEVPSTYWRGATSAGALVYADIPAGYVITGIYIQEVSGNAITGGLNIGTSSGAADVVSAYPVAGNSFSSVPAASILKTVFSVTASTMLYVSAVTNWNSANLNIVFRLARGILPR